MKTQHAVALAIAGIGLGAVATQGLHAQAKAPVYLVTEITVTNPQAYGKEFAPKAQASIKAAGGKQLAIGGSGGAGANKVTAVEGDPPKRVVIQVWDNLEKMKAWRDGAAYQEARKIGDKYATFRSYAIEGVSQ